MLLDLRNHPCDDVITRVQQVLDTKLNPGTAIRKRRSLGFRTDRDTWVRVEVRDVHRLSQGWGAESASVIQGVSMPRWFQGVSWLDEERGIMWRADETELIPHRPVISAGFLTAAPELPESWWATFNGSLAALANHGTVRRATPGLKPLTQDRFTDILRTVIPAGIDTTISEWTAAHGDLGWANLTAPVCYFLDWEDWGLAPRGFDAAMLRVESLAVPELAERIYQERRADLDSRSGQLAQLYHCAKLLGGPSGRSGPLEKPADALVVDLLTSLRA